MKSLPKEIEISEDKPVRMPLAFYLSTLGLAISIAFGGGMAIADLRFRSQQNHDDIVALDSKLTPVVFQDHDLIVGIASRFGLHPRTPIATVTDPVKP